MSGVNFQTGTNASGTDASGNWDEFSEFPRFLGRDAENSANMPPPLPRAPWYVRVQWMMRRTSPQRMAALATALVVLIPAATALVLDENPKRYTPAINVIQVKSIDQAPALVPQNIQTAAELEARLGYGLHIAAITDTAQTDQTSGDQLAETILRPADPPEPQDTPALIILRNLPENVTFTAGEPAGKGEWVMAASNPNQLDMKLGDGFDQPVAADVELVSHAGLTLGRHHLELRKNIAAVAEAQTVPASPPPVAMTEMGKAAPKSEAPAETEAKPRKAERRATTRRNTQFARANGGYIKRVKNPVRWKTETVAASNSASTQNATDAAPEKPEDETAKGPISKFFSWIASGGNSTAPADTPDSAKATLFPQ